MTTNCPICNQKLTPINTPDALLYNEYRCRQDDHFFTSRMKGDQILKVKVRLGSDATNDKLFLRVEYDKGTTEVWTKSYSDKVTISETMVPDFSDLKRLRNKIKTYLLFS